MDMTRDGLDGSQEPGTPYLVLQQAGQGPQALGLSCAAFQGTWAGSQTAVAYASTVPGDAEIASHKANLQGVDFLKQQFHYQIG